MECLVCYSLLVLPQIRRADVIEDAGRSMNPYVDVGQVEGAFIMGLGLYTSEKVKFDPSTGQKLSNGTWVRRPDLYSFCSYGLSAFPYLSRYSVVLYIG